MPDKPNLADSLPEPADYALLILKSGDEYTVILRDDAEARRISDFAEERWFNASELHSDPLAWREALKYAEKVYAFGRVLASR